MAKKAKRVLIILFIIVAIVGILLSPLFRLRKFDLNLGEEYTEEVNDFLQVLKGKNAFLELIKNKSFNQPRDILAFSYYKTEERLKFEFPYFREVRILYKFPNKLKVWAEEREAIFLCQVDSFYLYVDSEGYLLDIFVEEENLPNLPLVQGLLLEGYKIGQPISEMADEKTDITIRLCKLLRQIHPNENMIDIIDMADYEDIWMYVRPELAIRLGDESDMSLKLSILKEIFDNGYNGQSGGLIDFSKGGYPVFREND